MYIDSHAHLSSEDFDIDRDELISSLADNGIDYVIEIGADIKGSKNAVLLSKKYDNVYVAVGMHPECVDTFSDSDFDILESLAKESKVLAIGEIGLDYHYDYDKDKQKELFIKQILLADKLNLPIVVHLRDAYQDMEIILKEYKKHINNGILFHCYCGSKEMVKVFSFLDPYYAFGGAITFKNNNRADTIKAIPLDRLLLETDCPYMSPVPYRGKRNSPINIPIIAERMGDDLGMSKEDIGKITSENTRRFFRF